MTFHVLSSAIRDIKHYGTSAISYRSSSTVLTVKSRMPVPRIRLYSICKRWSNPCTGLDRPWPGEWGFQISRQLAHEGGKVVSPTHQLRLLETELKPGPSRSQKDMSMKNSSDTMDNWKCDLPACSAVPQPTAPQHVPYFKCSIQNS
jgi:hypothetical protein